MISSVIFKVAKVINITTRTTECVNSNRDIKAEYHEEVSLQSTLEDWQ